MSDRFIFTPRNLKQMYDLEGKAYYEVRMAGLGVIKARKAGHKRMIEFINSLFDEEHKAEIARLTAELAASERKAKALEAACTEPKTEARIDAMMNAIWLSFNECMTYLTPNNSMWCMPVARRAFKDASAWIINRAVELAKEQHSTPKPSCTCSRNGLDGIHEGYCPLTQPLALSQHKDLKQAVHPGDELWEGDPFGDSFKEVENG